MLLSSLLSWRHYGISNEDISNFFLKSLSNKHCKAFHHRATHAPELSLHINNVPATQAAFPLKTWEEVSKPHLFLHQPQGQGEESCKKAELGTCSQCKWQKESVKVQVTKSVDKSWLWALKLDRKPIVGDVGLEWKQAQSAGLSKTVLMFYLSNGPCKLAPLRLEIHIFSRTHRFSIRQVDMGKDPQGELWFLYFSDAVIVYSS